MTQNNIHTMENIVDELAHGKTFSQALKTVYSTRYVVIPYDEAINDVNVVDCKMSSRVINTLMRNHLATIGDVIEFCNNDNVMKIRGMGRQGSIELFEVILDWCWNHMGKKAKENFLIDTVERNTFNIKTELQ